MLGKPAGPDACKVTGTCREGEKKSFRAEGRGIRPHRHETPADGTRFVAAVYRRSVIGTLIAAFCFAA